MAKGGVVYVDLFEYPEKMPTKVAKIFDRYWEKYGDIMDYSDTANMLEEVENAGYTFDYYLDNEPYGLRPIGVRLNQLKGYEKLAGGGGVANVFSVGDIVELRKMPENLPFEIRRGVVDNKWEVVRVSMSGRSMYNDVMEDIFGYDISIIDTSLKYKMFVYPEEIKKYSKLADGGMMAKGGGINRYTIYLYYGGEMPNKVVKNVTMEEAKRLSMGAEHYELIDSKGNEIQIEYAGGGGVDDDSDDDEIDYNSISDLEDELRRLIRWSNKYGSKGADSKIEQLKKRIEYLKSNK
jgi:hypothetical protein